MSRNYYCEINLHIVWHTKSSLPVLTPELETMTHEFIRNRAFETPEVYFHEIGGTPTHVHLAVSVPPTLLISEWIGQLKGASSYAVNHQDEAREARLSWQAGYGVVSFGARYLDWVKQYIQNQKEHHRVGTVYKRLESWEAP